MRPTWLTRSVARARRRAHPRRQAVRLERRDQGGGRLGGLFVALAKPATAGVALKLIEEKGLEVSDEIITKVSSGRAESMERIDVGHKFSRTSAQKLCEERGGRLAYRRDLVDEKTMKLLVNDGKAYGGDKWTPVLDGDPEKDNEGIGWVQVGDKGRLGKNHKEAHHGDCGWGGEDSSPGYKGPWVWCVIEGPHSSGSFALMTRAPSSSLTLFFPKRRLCSSSRHRRRLRGAAATASSCSRRTRASSSTRRRCATRQRWRAAEKTRARRVGRVADGSPLHQERRRQGCVTLDTSDPVPSCRPARPGQMIQCYIQQRSAAFWGGSTRRTSSTSRTASSSSRGAPAGLVTEALEHISLDKDDLSRHKVA